MFTHILFPRSKPMQHLIALIVLPAQGDNPGEEAVLPADEHHRHVIHDLHGSLGNEDIHLFPGCDHFAGHEKTGLPLVIFIPEHYPGPACAGILINERRDIIDPCPHFGKADTG